MKSELDAVFVEKLKIGIEGEDIVYNWLIKNNSFVEDSRQQKHDEGAGPRLVGTEGKVVLPDFVVYNKDPKKGNFAVDVKVKTSVYNVNGKQCFTVDSKFEDYKRVVQIKKLDFLSIIFVYQDRLYVYKDTDVCGTTSFNNKYGNGLVYLFEYDKNKIRY